VFVSPKGVKKKERKKEREGKRGSSGRGKRIFLVIGSPQGKKCTFAAWLQAASLPVLAIALVSP
jgi:hypothetical protein